eukprot:447592-Pleurochrysis_carterae.AAC.1
MLVEKSTPTRVVIETTKRSGEPTTTGSMAYVKCCTSAEVPSAASPTAYGGWMLINREILRRLLISPTTTSTVI